MTASLDKIEEIQNRSILENAIDVPFYQEYKYSEKYFHKNWLYSQNRNEFIQKMKIKCAGITGDEVSNFIKIYLCSHPSEITTIYFSKVRFLWTMPKTGRRP